MNTIAIFDRLKRRPAASPTEAALAAPEPNAPPDADVGVNLAATAANAIHQELLRAPNQQLSTDPNDLGSILAFFEDGLDGYPNDTRTRIIKVLRGLAGSDDDVAGSVGDLRSMCGAGFTLDFQSTQGKGSRAIKAAEIEAAALLDRIFPEGGGASGLISNQVGEFALAGASSIEWVPLKNRQGIDRVAVVPAEELRIRRDAASGTLIYQQWGLGREVTLNTATYQYVALLTSGRRPYGTPLFVAALSALERKRQLLIAEQRVVNLMARSALISAEIPQPNPEQLGLRGVPAHDPRYLSAVRAFYTEVGKLIVSGSENGLYVSPGTAKLTIHPVAQTAAGAPEVMKGNQHRVWNGLRTQPFLRGELDSTTQALAQVTVPLVYAEAVMIQGGLKRMLEFGINLHLRLLGLPVQAFVKFTPPKSPFLLDEATAMLRRAEAHTKLAALFGPAWAQAAMRDWDIVDGDYNRAPDWWNPSAPTSTPPSEDPTTDTSGKTGEA